MTVVAVAVVAVAVRSAPEAMPEAVASQMAFEKAKVWDEEVLTGRLVEIQWCLYNLVKTMGTLDISVACNCQ